MIFSNRSALMLVTSLAMAVASQNIQAATEQQFDSPEAAVAALTNAAVASDTNAIVKIFGSEGQELISPDVVQATESFKSFTQHLAEKTELIRVSEQKAIVQIGNEGWPFPIPLVQTNGHWIFDVAEGKDEILNRRIGRDELGAIAVCRSYVDAQREYAGRDRMGDGVLAYAQHLRSSTNSHDGLYWPAKNEGDEESPFGPLISEARAEGYHHSTGMMTENPTPYHGYYFKILTHQGKHAPGGKYCYVINGRMIAGFALIAWPAEWNNTGIMTFIVNQQGQVYQKNLGPKTASKASSIKTYDPDNTWSPVTQ